MVRVMNTDEELIRKNMRLGLIIMAVVLGMVALSFAAVPLYGLFCRVTGFGGTTQVSASLPDTILDRKVTVAFNTSKGRNFLWDFKPEIRKVDIRLGERGIASFYAKNNTDSPLTGVALYNVTPLKAGKYFHKIQCFCFNEQTLQAGQEVSMPVLFYVDPAMDEDPDMADVTTITLSYTFFQAETAELDRALQDFYNEPSNPQPTLKEP